MRFLVALAPALALSAAAPPACAEMWVSSMGQLLKEAKRVELVEIATTKAGSGVATGKIVEAFRSTNAPGATVTFDLAGLELAPSKGDRLLVVCDDSECPRAAGVEREGWFGLAARQPMDSGAVVPNLVARSSIRTLAAGKPAPDICVNGTIALLDAPQATPSFSARVSAADGAGSATIGARKVNATLSTLGVGRHGAAAAFEFRQGKGELGLATERINRAASGCLEGRFEPDRPIVRTEKGLGQALDGTFTRHPFARGTLAIAKGPEAGAHPITLSTDEHGQLILDSDLGKGSSDYQSLKDGHTLFGFAAKGQGTYPKFLLEFALGRQSALALLFAKKTLATPVYRLGDASSAKPAPLGTVTLQYVPE